MDILEKNGRMSHVIFNSGNCGCGGYISNIAAAIAGADCNLKP